jgi:glycosyltransferase involved in cell wall biosynthesis
LGWDDLVEKKQHVLIATPVLLVGGTEIQTFSLAKVLIEAGCAATVCCYYEYDQSMVDRFEDAGARVLLMKYERAEGLWYLAKRLHQLFKSMKPDVVHVQYVAPGLVPIIAAKLAGIKIVFATVHQPGSAYGWKAKMLLRTAARFCTAFFCVSRAVEESWFGSSKLFDPEEMDVKRKHFTIYNAVDTDRIAKISRAADRRALRNSLGIGDGPVVGIVARLRTEKGQAVLLNAMAEVIKRMPEARLLIVGVGPDRETFEKLAKDLNIAEQIIWVGQKSPDEIYQLYGVMDVVAVPSLFEGFGLSAAEAMAAGVPVVASRVGGLTEVVQDATSGYLVDVGDINELAQSLGELLRNPEKTRAMGQEGYRRVNQGFSFERFREAISAMYKEFAKV